MKGLREENERTTNFWQKLGENLGYIDKKCINCGRLRVEKYSSGNEVCEKCGKNMIKKLGRFGFFLACSGFPECHNTRSIPLAKCPMPECNGEIVTRKTKGRGKEVYGCTN